MARGILQTGPKDSVMNAIRLMSEHGVRHLFVIEGETLRGLVSNRDVIRVPLRNPERKLDLTGTAVETIMTPAVVLHTTTPGTSLSDAARQLQAAKISALPVFEEGALIGILTSDDILSAVAAGELVPRSEV